MRNIALFCMLLAGFAMPVRSQIIITKAVFPALGDTLFYAIDNQPGQIEVTPPGGNQRWDFSGLKPSLAWEQVFKDARTGAGSSSFPGATLFYKPGSGSVEAYLKVTDREVSFLGFHGGDPIGLGLDLVSQFNPPIVQIRAPLKFFDITPFSSGLLLPFSVDKLPEAVVRQLPVRPDSLRIRIAISGVDVVDGWGSLSIPGGTFDVLRQKRTEYRETRLDAKVPILGWLDVTDVAIQSLKLKSLGVDTTVTYHFLNDRSKEAIAICTMDRSGLQALNVQFKNIDRTTGVNDAVLAGAELKVFPNPVAGLLQIRATGISAGNYTLVIHNSLGEELWRKTLSVGGEYLEETADLSRLGNGVYLCSLFKDRVHVGQARVLKFR